MQEGMFYLFYGTNRVILDAMVYRLLVNCGPSKNKHGFESMAICFNNIGVRESGAESHQKETLLPTVV